MVKLSKSRINNAIFFEKMGLIIQIDQENIVGMIKVTNHIDILLIENKQAVVIIADVVIS